MRSLYTHGHAAAVVSHHAKRTAPLFAPVALGLLRSGDSILDVGCGPGSITKGFRAAVGPSGRVVGIDVEEKVLGEARAMCGADAEIKPGDVYNLKEFGDQTMDVVHAHQVLQHLTDPARALKEMKRVAKRRVVCRDVIYSSWSWSPPSKGMDRWLSVYKAVASRNRGDPDCGASLLRLFNDAGLREVAVRGDVVSYTSSEAVKTLADTWAQRVSQTRLGEHAIAYGLSSKEDNEAMAQAWRHWGAQKDACLFYIDVTAVGSI